MPAATRKEAHTASATRKEPAGRKQITLALPEIPGVSLAAITTVAACLLLVFLVFQTGQAYALTKKINAIEKAAAEQNKLPVIEVFSIVPDCQQCQPLAPVLSQVESSGANITRQLELTPDDAHSRQLMSRYAVTRLPAIIATGEVNRTGLSSLGFKPVADALVYQSQAPYVDLASGKIKGLVTITYVNASTCKECPDLMPAIGQLRDLVTVRPVKAVDRDSAEGKALIAKYAMARLPGIVISPEISEYAIAEQLAAVGTVESDGTITLGANLPYINVSTGKVSGIAQLILLNDSTCAGCYDVNTHVPIVRDRFQVYLSSTKIVDVGSAEGKALIAQYKINAVPTVLITGDAGAYDALVGIWKSIGTIEKDGTFVFRAMSAIAGSHYKNLTTGKIDQNAPRQATQ